MCIDWIVAMKSLLPCEQRQQSQAEVCVDSGQQVIQDDSQSSLHIPVDESYGKGFPYIEDTKKQKTHYDIQPGKGQEKDGQEKTGDLVYYNLGRVILSKQPLTRTRGPNGQGDKYYDGYGRIEVPEIGQDNNQGKARQGTECPGGYGCEAGAEPG